MIPPRLRSLLNSILWVLGAVLIGGALNSSVVSGEASITAPGIVLQFVVGAGLLLVGYLIRPTSDTLPGRSEDADEERNGSFDPALSPLADDSEDEPPR